jgi:hypothetical protein
LRAQIDEWRKLLQDTAEDGTLAESVETMHRVRAALKREKQG